MYDHVKVKKFYIQKMYSAVKLRVWEGGGGG